YRVAGMTCAHCVHAVTTEVSSLPQVTAVSVDLGAGAVTVTSTDPLAIDTVRGAIDEAGYELVS
ncbi:MAG TPA: heavy metal-associated domain-containing protein, partial [Micromonosporaceae bacterium]